MLPEARLFRDSADRVATWGLRGDGHCEYKVPQMQTQSAALRTMVVRVSPNDMVIYANSALAAYLGVSKKELIGTPLEVLAKRSRGEISSCFARPETGRSSNHLVTDEAGRVFEAKVYSDGGVLDIVLDEVTTADSIGRELRESSGTPFESLSEEELRTTRHPERRYLTVSRTRLRGLSPFTERLPPMEVRLMVNSFVEEACDAIFETGCTVGETSGDSVLGIFGAPRHYADHPLRAIRAACDQLQKASQMHAGFYREGKELPPCSCGLWTGDTLVGTLGNSAWQHYTAIGLPVDLADKLCQLARPGEVLLPEHTLTHLLRTLPEGWQHVRAESEFEPDLSDFQWTGDEIAPLPEVLRRAVYLVGPGVQEKSENVEFYFDYLWAYRVPGRDTPVPILRVVRPAQVGDGLELREDNVVTTQAVQTLGKYKLLEVIGTGGMGRVWRGVDRFGNAVAIKVLHSAEAVTEAQLRRFRREAEVMAKLPHRNICRVYEMNEFDGIQYIAMEFVDGLPLADLLYEQTASEASGLAAAKGDLRALIHSLKSERSQSRSTTDGTEEDTTPRPKNTRILPTEQTLSIILKVCDAVQFAHEHGVLHRDLKPGNILLRDDGEPLVADFGLAKLNSPDATHSLSVSGHVVGTLENMSPEQAESSKDVDERADVYSIGTMLYQMLTGRRHFEATGNIVADAQALKTHEPVRPRALNPHIEPDLEIITLKALRNDPVERYRSVAALAADIQHYRRGEVISARPVHFVEVFKKLVQRNRAVSAVIVSAVLIFIVGTLVAITILSRSLAEQKQLNARLQEKEAEVQKQYLLATEIEKQVAEREADVKTLKAEVEDEQVRAALLANKAEKALADLQAAQAAIEEERQKSSQAAAATQEEKRLREEAENNLARKLEEIERDSAEGGDSSVPDRFAGPGGRVRDGMPAVHEAFHRANQSFFLEASPFAYLGQGFGPEKSPEEILARLNTAMDHVTEALILNPDFFPGWMLKGRIHLALMEFGRAEESFRRAGQVAGGFPGMAAKDPPSAMLEMMEEFSGGFGDKFSKGAEILRGSPEQQNQTTGQLLGVLAGKPALRRSSTDPAGPLGRPLTMNEAALALLGRNPPGTRVFVKSGGIGTRPEVIIWGADEIPDLSPLKEARPGGLTVVAAKKMDWPTLINLPEIEALDFSHCDLGFFPDTPQTQRSFLRLKSLTLTRTHVSNLDFVRTMPLLERLDLSETEVTDLSPLVRSDRLRHLNLAGLNPKNLRVLLNLSLESITLSPMLITDKTELDSLRLHRKLLVLRAPGDPEDQSPADFWRKLDSGGYETSD